MYNMPEAAKPPFYQRYLVQRVSNQVEQLCKVSQDSYLDCSNWLIPVN